MIGLWVVRRSYSTESVLATFAARLVVNIGLIAGSTSSSRSRPLSAIVIFFLVLFCVLITLYDRYRPVYEYRFHAA